MAKTVADDVLFVDFDDVSADLTEVIPQLAHDISEGGFTWSEEPPSLPPAPPVDADDTERASMERDDEALASLDNPTSDTDLGEGDRASLQQQARRARSRQLQPDALAFYRSFATLDPGDAAGALTDSRGRWGTFITSGGVELLGRERFLEACDGDIELALRCATAYLVGHETGHGVVDVALAHAALESAFKDEGTSLVQEHRAMHDGSACRLEEAFCEAYGLQFLARTLQQIDLPVGTATRILDTARQHVADGLPGYRDGAKAKNEQDVFELLVNVLRHAGIEDPESVALAADPGRLAARAGDIPMHVVVTPGSALARLQWFFSAAKPIDKP